MGIIITLNIIFIIVTCINNKYNNYTHIKKYPALNYGLISQYKQRSLHQTWIMYTLICSHQPHYMDAVCNHYVLIILNDTYRDI